MKLVHGLLDYSVDWALPDIYLFTGNPIRRNDGAIVMGRGAALAVKKAHPQVPYKLRLDGSHVCFYPIKFDQWIGWFMVKTHWNEDASLDLILKSAELLANYAHVRSDLRFHMNYPGVGNGRLNKSQVHPILEAHLPDNVILYR